MVNRRDFLKLSALAAPGTLAFGNVFAQADAIQFGCPVPMSGAFAANGKYADIGMKLVLQKYGKVLGKTLTYTTIDTEGKPATAVRKMQEAVEKGTHFFAGGILSSESLAMGKEAEKTKSVFITTAGADEITGSECNAATFRAIVWLAKLDDITKLGWPVPQPRFTKRPLASRMMMRLPSGCHIRLRA